MTSIYGSVREDLLRVLEHAAGGRAVTILSDYAKGVLGDGIAAAAIAIARAAGHAVVVDPKGTDYAPYRGASILKPNRRELGAATKLSVSTEAEVTAAARALIDDFELGAVLVSLSQEGMLLVEAGGAVHHLDAEAREVFDVSGAGDTVVAVLGAALGAGASLLDAARLANIAAGIVVGKVGTAVVHASELEEAIVSRDALAGQKLLPLPVALDHVARWRLKGLFAAPEGQSSDYRMAAGMDPNLAALVGSTITGEPFDAAQEKAAKDKGWR